MGQVLIDGNLVFDEDNFLLFRMDNSEEEPLRLGAIASRCLAMLLRSGGTVVRKRELMAEAWGQFGLEVTDNSLAQVVRQLRLALEKLQPDREFIQTWPRIGYKLCENVHVEELPAVAKQASAACVAIPSSEMPAPVVEPMPTMVDTADDGVEPLTMPAIETASGSQPTATPLKRWGFWVALPLWGALAFLLGRNVLVVTPEVIPQVFAAPVMMNEVHVHLPVQDLQTMTSSYLQPMVVHSQKLAKLEGLSLDNLHLYLLPARRGLDQILCDGELETLSNRCIGVQQHD